MINFPTKSQTRSTGQASSRLSSGRIKDRTREMADIEPTVHINRKAGQNLRNVITATHMLLRTIIN